jgi:hypothetical protein
VKLSRVRLALTCLALTLALFGCGGSSSSGVTAAAYVKSVCGTLAAWKTDVTGAAGKLQTASSAAKTLAAGKREYVVFVTSLVAATRRAAAGLQAAGVPNVTNGKQGATALSQAFAHASTSLAGTITQAQAIPTTSASAYQAAASGVSNQFKQSLNGLANASPKRNGQLRAAAVKDPTCKALNAG